MRIFLSTRLKQLRKDKRLTQSQVAKRVGVTRSMISSYETDIRCPSFDILVSLSRLYGVTVDYLLTMDDKKYLDITGLSDQEISVISDMVSLLRTSKTEQKEYTPMREVI